MEIVGKLHLLEKTHTHKHIYIVCNCGCSSNVNLIFYFFYFDTNLQMCICFVCIYIYIIVKCKPSLITHSDGDELCFTPEFLVSLQTGFHIFVHRKPIDVVITFPPLPHPGYDFTKDKQT